MVESSDAIASSSFDELTVGTLLRNYSTVALSSSTLVVEAQLISSSTEAVAVPPLSIVDAVPVDDSYKVDISSNSISEFTNESTSPSSTASSSLSASVGETLDPNTSVDVLV